MSIAARLGQATVILCITLAAVRMILRLSKRPASILDRYRQFYEH